MKLWSRISKLSIVILTALTLSIALDACSSSLCNERPAGTPVTQAINMQSPSTSGGDIHATTTYTEAAPQTYIGCAAIPSPTYVSVPTPMCNQFGQCGYVPRMVQLNVGGTGQGWNNEECSRSAIDQCSLNLDAAFNQYGMSRPAGYRCVSSRTQICRI